jgi:hypothetical protein
VLDDVGQRLLGHAVKGRLQGGRQTRAFVEMQDHLEPGLVDAGLGVPPQGGGQAQVVQHRRPQVVDRRLELIEREREEAAGRIERLPGHSGVGEEPPPARVDLEERRSQDLDRVVVQLPPDSLPLGLDRSEQPGGEMERVVFDPVEQGACRAEQVGQA